jgi:hypothetical protein
MQREELSDSRNRQAAPRNEGQNEGQIWQRHPAPLGDMRLPASASFRPLVGNRMPLTCRPASWGQGSRSAFGHGGRPPPRFIDVSRLS